MSNWNRPIRHGLNCSCCHPARLTASDDSDRDVSTSNKEDLRRSRQRARAVMGAIGSDVTDYVDGLDLSFITDEGQQVRTRISDIAAGHLEDDLLDWLDDRRTSTMGRGFRDALDKMTQSTTQATLDDFRGGASFTNADQELAEKLSNVDAGLLFDDQGNLAEEIGNDVTQVLQDGVRDGEDIEDLGERVDLVLNDGDQAARRKRDIKTGMTKRSKGELIAHDSIQDAHNTAARKRYAQNGFRYVRYETTLDTRTTDLCTDLSGKVFDILENPDLQPPNHPYCRSGVSPVLDPDDVTTPAEIDDEFLQTIGETNAYRPTVDVSDEFEPTDLTAAAF